MKTILVTGAAGFIGSHICKNLVVKNYRVVGADNLSFGEVRNIEPLLQHENFSFFKVDVSKPEGVNKISNESGKIDFVMHLAAYKIPKFGGRLNVLLNNVESTKAMLKLCVDNGAKMVFTSSSDVYGMNTHLPFKEEGSLILGETKVRRWAYAVSKIYDEHLCFSYIEEHNLPVTILRYFGVYGPNQHLSWRSGPVAIFTDAILNNKEIIVHGDGSQTRTFLYIDDAVDATVKAMEISETNGEILNIGSTEEISILDLAHSIKKVSNTKERLKIRMVKHEELFGRYDEVMRRVPDISKANELLEWQPTTSLENGLKKTIRWQKGLT